MAHECHMTGCSDKVPPRVFACKRHWYMVPKPIRDRIWASYRSGQEADKRPSVEYCEAAIEAVTHVAHHEGRVPDVVLYEKLIERASA